MSKKPRIKPKTSEELAKSIRRDWGNVNPVTRVIPSKKKYDKKKERQKGSNYND